MATNVSRSYSIDNFFKVVTDPNGKDILDPYTFLWTDFPYYLRNSNGSVQRIDASLDGVPDLISWDNYGTHDFWWIISIANQMIEPDTEITPGMNLFLPYTTDITNFYQQTVARSQQGRLVSLLPGALVRSAPTVPPTGTFTLGSSVLGGSNVLG